MYDYLGFQTGADLQTLRTILVNRGLYIYLVLGHL
jgi:hypothetical protein